MRPSRKSSLDRFLFALCGALLLASVGAARAQGENPTEPVVLDPIALGNTPDGNVDPEPADPEPTDPGNRPRPGDRPDPDIVVFEPPELQLLSGPAPVAYSWANDARSGGYEPMALYSKVPGKGGVKAGRGRTGDYRVSLSGFRPAPGKGSNVQVTAYGIGGERCKVASWSHAAPTATLSARVRCFDAAGRPADSQFSLLATGAFAGRGRGGYLWANQPTASSYAPTATYAYNSTGGAIEVHRGGTGEYKVVFSGLGGKRPGGNVQITAHGTSNTHCNLGDWDSRGTDYIAVVRCHDPAGRPADSTFSALVTWPTGAAPRAGYMWADQPSAAAYRPASSHAFNSGGKPPTVRRNRPGSYTVTFPGLGGGRQAGANVQVTAQGTNGACKVRNWGTGGTDATLNIDCHDAAGRAADTRFTALVLW